MKNPSLPIRILLWLVIAILLIAGASAVYNAVTLALYRHAVEIPGKLYDINGAPVHIYCTGQGTPTIVLDAGLGDNFTTWAKVQPALSKVTRVCSYGRSGFGWSEARAGARDAKAITAELHGLLATEGVQTPFVLMGNSIAGLYLRSHAAHHPEQSAGLVFVDGATPLQDDRVPRSLVDIQIEQRKQLPYQQVLMSLGLVSPAWSVH